MNFFESIGVITLYGNSHWQGAPLQPSTAGMYSEFFENPESGFSIRYNNHQLSVSLEIGIMRSPVQEYILSVKDHLYTFSGELMSKKKIIG